MKSTPLKMITFCGAAAALATMGVVTLDSPSTGASSPSVIAGGGTNLTPVTTTAPKFGGTVKPTTFNGGDWPGMGAFGEDWAK
jgi:hypothetical protein